MEVVLQIAARKTPGIRARVFRALADHGTMEDHRILSDNDSGTLFEIRFQWRDAAQAGSAAALLYGIDGVVEVHETPSPQQEFSLAHIVAPAAAPPAEAAHLVGAAELQAEARRGPRIGFVGLALAGAAIAGGVAYFVIGKQPGGQSNAAPPVPAAPVVTAIPEATPVPAAVPVTPALVQTVPAAFPAEARAVAAPAAPVTTIRPAVAVRPPAVAATPAPVRTSPRPAPLPMAAVPAAAPAEQPLIPAAVPAVQASPETPSAAVPTAVTAAPAPAPPPAAGGSRKLVRVQIAPGSNQGR